MMLRRVVALVALAVAVAGSAGAVARLRDARAQGPRVQGVRAQDPGLNPSVVRGERPHDGPVQDGLGLGPRAPSSAPTALGGPASYPPCDGTQDPDTACTLPPSEADRVLGRETGPPVYGRPAYAQERGETGWAACGPPSRGVSSWDGCDPFAGGGAAFHYDKPYGSAQDAAALLLWEPGRGERGYEEGFPRQAYFQSDSWRGPASWNDGYYGGVRRDSQGGAHLCGGGYVQDLQITGPDGTQQPVPGFEDHRGYGLQGCT